MNATIKEAWVKALRSGEYVQKGWRLRSGEKEFDAEGVLVDLFAKAKKLKWVEPSEEEPGYVLVVKDRVYRTETPSAVLKWAERAKEDYFAVGATHYTIAGLGDLAGLSFEQIAAIIEEKM